MGWVTLTLRKRELKQSHAYYQIRDLQISREERQLARRKQHETSVIQNDQQKSLQPLKTSYNEAVEKLDEKRNALNKYLRIAREIADNQSNDITVNPSNPKEVLVDTTNGKYVKTSSNATGSPICSTQDANGNIQFVEYKDLKTTADGMQVYYPGTSSWGTNTGIPIDTITRFDMYDFSSIIDEFSLPSLDNIDENNIGTLETTISSELSNIQIERQDAQTNYTEDVNYEKTYYEDELAMLEEEVNDQETMLELKKTDVESQMEAVSQEMQAVSEAVSSEIQNSTIKLA